MASSLAHPLKRSPQCPGTLSSQTLTFPLCPALSSLPLVSPEAGRFSPTERACLPTSFWVVKPGLCGGLAKGIMAQHSWSYLQRPKCSMTIWVPQSHCPVLGEGLFSWTPTHHHHHQGPPSRGVGKGKGRTQCNAQQSYSRGSALHVLAGWPLCKTGYPLQDGDNSEW